LFEDSEVTAKLDVIKKCLIDSRELYNSMVLQDTKTLFYGSYFDL